MKFEDANVFNVLVVVARITDSGRVDSHLCSRISSYYTHPGPVTGEFDTN